MRNTLRQEGRGGDGWKVAGLLTRAESADVGPAGDVPCLEEWVPGEVRRGLAAQLSHQPSAGVSF